MPLPETMTVPHELVTTPEQIINLQAYLEGLPLFAFDTETTGLDWTRSRIFMISISDGKRSWVIPTNRFPTEQIKYFLWAILRDHSKSVVGHNLKFDAHHIQASFGIPINRQWNDTLLMAYLLDENRSNALKNLMPDLLGITPDDEKKIHDWMKAHQGKRENWDFSQVPEELMVPYAAMDPWATYRLYEKLRPEIDTHFKEIYDTERQVSRIVWKLEQNGLLLDRGQLRSYADRREQAGAEARARLFAHAGREFNPDSPDDLRKDRKSVV